MATDRTPGAVAWMAAAAYRASQRSRRNRLRRCPWGAGTAGSAWWSTRRRAGGGRCGCCRRSPPCSTRQAPATRSASRPAWPTPPPSPPGLPGWVRGWSPSAAAAVGLPAGPRAAAAVLIAGGERRVDLIGVATPGQPETVVACSVYVGIPSVAGEIANRTRWLRGPIVYSVAALRALAGWAPTAFRVEIRRSDRPEEGGGALVRDFAGYAVVVANAAYFGAGMRVAPPAQLDDGMLDIVSMRHGPRLAFIRTLLRVRNGSHTGLAQISLDRGTEVTVTVGRDLPAAADGETLPCPAPLQPGTPLHIRALPPRFPPAAPAGSAR